MKKLQLFIIIVALLFGLTGCSGNSPTPSVSIQLPEDSEETSSPEPEIEFSFDPYVLPSDATAYLGDDLPYYQQLVDAVLERQESVSLPEESMSKAVSCLLAEFPLCALMNDFYYDWESSAVTFSYIYDKEEHTAHIRDFEDRVAQAIRTSISSSYNDCEKALSLYRWTANNISYVDGNDVSVYHALMDGEGICQSYDGVLRFLLLQSGIDALSAAGFMDDGVAHQWTIVRLNDQWFHMDPTFEDSDNCGDGLCFFGMNDSAREQTGTIVPFTTGVDGWCATAPLCESDCFNIFSTCVYWKLKANTHQILLFDSIGNEPYAVFDTLSYKARYLQ